MRWREVTPCRARLPWGVHSPGPTSRWEPIETNHTGGVRLTPTRLKLPKNQRMSQKNGYGGNTHVLRWARGSIDEPERSDQVWTSALDQLGNATAKPRRVPIRSARRQVASSGSNWHFSLVSQPSRALRCTTEHATEKRLSAPFSEIRGDVSEALDKSP